MSEIDDSNIYHRAGVDVAQEVKRLAQKAKDDFSPANIDVLCQYCHKQWVSPGGSADMLILTLFIDRILRQK